MEQSPVYVGLDYHQHSVQVCVVDASGRILRNRSVGNFLCEIAGVVSGLGTVARVTVEACCGSANLAQCLRDQAAWPVELAHPGIVNRMKANPDKSDYTDARMLAELGRTGFVPRVWLAPEDVRQLRALVRYRQQLVDRRRTVKLRITALLREARIVEDRRVGARHEVVTALERHGRRDAHAAVDQQVDDVAVRASDATHLG